VGAGVHRRMGRRDGAVDSGREMGRQVAGQGTQRDEERERLRTTAGIDDSSEKWRETTGAEVIKARASQTFTVTHIREQQVTDKSSITLEKVTFNDVLPFKAARRDAIAN